VFGGSLIIISAIAPSPPHGHGRSSSELHQLQIRLAHGFHEQSRPKNDPAGLKRSYFFCKHFSLFLLMQAFQGEARFVCGASVFSRFLQDPPKASVPQKQPADRCGSFATAP